jgi:hypothetical protein
MHAAMLGDRLKLVVGEAEERRQRALVDLLREALPLPALTGGEDLDGHLELDLEVGHRLPAAIGLGRQAVAPRRLQPPVAGELGDQHDVVARSHQAGHERVAQHVRRQLQPCATGDTPHSEIDRP